MDKSFFTDSPIPVTPCCRIFFFTQSDLPNATAKLPGGWAYENRDEYTMIDKEDDCDACL
ncbi:hypothetical protein [Sporomusa carbonis]|uniref:hypothetical protein n=1 Tax=Sporomusa carbonis TaxID=3076075 RepID=UPI003C79E8B2